MASPNFSLYFAYKSCKARQIPVKSVASSGDETLLANKIDYLLSKPERVSAIDNEMWQFCVKIAPFPEIWKHQSRRSSFSRQIKPLAERGRTLRPLHFRNQQAPRKQRNFTLGA